MPGILIEHSEDSNDSQNAAVTNHWLRLSNEMALSILCLLPRKDLVTISRVNRKFRDLSKDDSLWTKLTLDYGNIKENIQSCRALVARCGKLSHLKITNEFNKDESDTDDEHTSVDTNNDDDENYDDEYTHAATNDDDEEEYDDTPALNIMCVVIEAEATLTTLQIDSGWTVAVWSPNALAQLGQMKQLKKLFLGFDVKYSGLKHLAGLTNLTDFKVWLHEYESSAFVTMKTYFSQFNKLEVVHLNDIDDVSSDEMVMSLASNNPSLRELSFYDWWTDEDEGRVLTNNSLLSLAENCPNLEFISIPVYAAEGVLEKLVTSCPKLRHIQLEGSLIEDDAFGKLGDSGNGSALQHIQMNYAPNISIEGIRRLVSSAENLKSLAVYWPGPVLDHNSTGKLVNKEDFYKLQQEYPKVDMSIYFFAH